MTVDRNCFCYTGEHTTRMPRAAVWNHLFMVVYAPFSWSVNVHAAGNMRSERLNPATRGSSAVRSVVIGSSIVIGAHGACARGTRTAAGRALDCCNRGRAAQTELRFRSDKHGAAGPNHYAETVNRDFTVYDKATGAQRANVPLDSSLPGPNGDPHVP